MLSSLPEDTRERIKKEATTKIPICDKCTADLGKNKTCQRVLKDGNVCGGSITYLNRLDMAHEYEERYGRVPIVLDQPDLLPFVFPVLKVFNGLTVTDIGYRTLDHQELLAVSTVYDLDYEESSYWESILRDMLAAEAFGASVGRNRSKSSRSSSSGKKLPKLGPNTFS